MKVVNLTLIQTGDNDMLVSWVEPDSEADLYRVCQDHLDSEVNMLYNPGSLFPPYCVDIPYPNNQTTLASLYPGGSYTVNVTSVSNDVYTSSEEQQLVMGKPAIKYFKYLNCLMAGVISEKSPC